MKRLYAPFLQQLWSVNGNAPILPEHLLAKYNDDKGSFNTAPYNALPVGSGPFKVVAWNRGQDVHLVANPRFLSRAPEAEGSHLQDSARRKHGGDAAAHARARHAGDGDRSEMAGVRGDGRGSEERSESDSRRRLCVGARRLQPAPSDRRRRAGASRARLRDRSQRDHTEGRSRFGDSRPFHRSAAALFLGLYRRRRALSVRPREGRSATRRRRVEDGAATASG